MLHCILLKLQSQEIEDDGFNKAAPLVIFGGSSFIAGLMAFSLPETLGRSLPDSLTDAEKFGK